MRRLWQEGVDSGPGKLADMQAIKAEARRCFEQTGASESPEIDSAFTEAFPEAGGGLDLCPTEEPAVRQGWPPLPGDYHVLKYRAPVAVCTLHSAALAAHLKDRVLDSMAIVGTLHTENLDIERLIKNTLANPHVRFLIVCGNDTRQAIGHLPGQSLQSLFAHGVDARQGMREARGKVEQRHDPDNAAEGSVRMHGIHDFGLSR